MKKQSAWMEKCLAHPILKNAPRDLDFRTRLLRLISVKRTLKTMEKYQEAAAQAAEKYAVPLPLLQSVLFREMVGFGAEDPVMDLICRMRGKFTSSTGLCQIKPKTALRAEMAVLGESAQDMKGMFFKLQNPGINIAYAAMVLKMEALGLGYDTENMDRQQMEDVLTRYNGARVYGKAVIRYSDAFAECLK